MRAGFESTATVFGKYELTKSRFEISADTKRCTREMNRLGKGEKDELSEKVSPVSLKI